MLQRQRPCSSSHVRFASFFPSTPAAASALHAHSPRYMLRLTARRDMPPGEWRGASGTVHQSSFDMVPVAGSSMCGRNSMLIHGGDCSSDPSRVRSARSNLAFHASSVCTSALQIILPSVPSGPSAFSPILQGCIISFKMAPLWKLCSKQKTCVHCSGVAISLYY
jgi:hypothetical protein